MKPLGFKRHKILPLNEWNLYAGTPFRSGGAKHSYDLYVDDDSSPWRKQRQFTIAPSGNDYGYFKFYRLSVYPGKSNSGHESIGSFRRPQLAVKAAREWFDSIAPQANSPETKIYSVFQILWDGRPFKIAAANSFRSAQSIKRKLDKKYPKYTHIISSGGAFLPLQKFKKPKKLSEDIFKQFEENPPETKIYERVIEVVAVKGPGHRCDAACKRARHTYVHKFTRKSGVYGSADGSKISIHE